MFFIDLNHHLNTHASNPVTYSNPPESSAKDRTHFKVIKNLA